MARRVFHRLGLPSPSSIAKYTRPAWVLQQALQHVDGRVERPPRRTILLLAVPAAVAHLLTEEPVHDALDVLAEVGSDRNDLPVDAGLHLAREEGLAVVLPSAALANQA